MTKTIEYRVIPMPCWSIVRFEKSSDGQCGSVGSSQRGEFRNQREANEVAELIASTEEGAVFIGDKCMKLSMQSGPIGGGGLSSS